MPDSGVLIKLDALNEAAIDQVMASLRYVADPATLDLSDFTPEELKAYRLSEYQNKKKLEESLQKRILDLTTQTQKQINAGILSEEAAAANHARKLELLAKDAEINFKDSEAKASNDLWKIRAQGENARAKIIAEGQQKLERDAQSQRAKKDIETGKQALARELPGLKVEAETAKLKAKLEAKINEAEFLPQAAARGEIASNQIKQAEAIKLAEDNYKIQHSLLKRAIKLGEPIPDVPAAALSIMEPGGFKAKLEVAQEQARANAQTQLAKLKVTNNIIDPVALQPLTEKVGAGQRITVEDINKAVSTQKAVGTLQEEFLKQGIKIGPDNTTSLVKPPLFGGGKITDSANTGIKELLSLIQKTGTLEPGKAAALAQAAKSAGRLGIGKLAAGGAIGAFLLSQLFGKEKTPEMSPQQQMILAQQLQEQQQKAALVQSLIQQRQAGAENDMAKAMLLRMQMMQGQGGGGAL